MGNEEYKIETVKSATLDDILEKIMQQYYRVESRPKTRHNGKQWRYYSLYNGSRGAWYSGQKEAEEEGKMHQRIIRPLVAPKLETFETSKERESIKKQDKKKSKKNN